MKYILLFVLIISLCYSATIDINKDAATFKTNKVGDTQVTIQTNDNAFTYQGQTNHFYIVKIKNSKGSALNGAKSGLSNIVSNKFIPNGADMYQIDSMDDYSNDAGNFWKITYSDISTLSVKANTEQPYLLKVQTPLWSQGNFNVSVMGVDLDPQVSACGTYSADSYNMINDIVSNTTCITLGDNTVFDCAGFKITGNRTVTPVNYGIYDTGDRKNVTVKNCIIESFSIGMYMDGLINGTIDNVTARNNTQTGIVIRSGASKTDVIANSTAYNNGQYGIWVGVNQYDSMVINNSAYNNTRSGFYITQGGYNISLINNSAYLNGFGGLDIDGTVQTVDNITIINFTSYNNTQNGIYARTARKLWIYNSTIYNNTQNGFLTDTSCRDVIVSDSIFTGNVFSGIALANVGSYNFLFINNTLRNNGRSGFNFGSNSSNLTLLQNTAFENIWGAIDAAPSFSINPRNIYVDNFTAYNNKIRGITINNITNFTCNLCTIINNTQDGILIANNALNTIISNSTITNNTKNGINLNISSVSTNITNNKIYENTFDGISIQNSSIMSITGNNISSNTLAGVKVLSSSSVSMLNNTIQQNKYVSTSVQFEDSNTLTLNYNNISENSQNIIMKNITRSSISYNLMKNATISIILNQSNFINILGNIIFNYSDSSMRIINSTNNSISFNRVYNGTYGIRLMQANFTNISNNSIINNTYNGLFVNLTESANISFNNISGATYGIIFDDSNSTEVANNSIFNNSYIGIILKNTNNTQIYGNNIGNNTVVGILLNDSLIINTKIYGNTILYHNQSGAVSTGSFGIFAGNISTYTEIYNNNFTTNTVGIFLNNSNYFNITNNIFDNDTYYDIYLKNITYTNISFNSFNYHGTGAGGYPVYLYGNSSFNLISNNSATAAVDAYRLDGDTTTKYPRYNIFQYNNASGSSNAAILPYGAGNNLFKGNYFSTNVYGVYIDPTFTISTTGDNFTENAFNNSKIFLNNQRYSSATFSYNNFSNCASNYCVRFYSGGGSPTTNFYFYNNNFTSGNSEAIYLDEASSIVMTNNTFTNFTGNAILGATSFGGTNFDYSIRGNTFYNISHSAINMTAPNAANLVSDISGNTIYNATVGIYLNSANFSSIANNTIINTTFALYFYDAKGFDILNNTIYYSQNGIFLNKTHTSNITKNNIANSTKAGIYLYQSNYNTMNNSIIFNNTISLNLSNSTQLHFYDSTLANESIFIYMEGNTSYNLTNVTIRNYNGINASITANNSNMSIGSISGTSINPITTVRYITPTQYIAINVTGGNASSFAFVANKELFSDNMGLANASNIYWWTGSAWSLLSSDFNPNKAQISTTSANNSFYTIFGNPSLCLNQVTVSSVYMNTTYQNNISIGMSYLNLTGNTTVNNSCWAAINNTYFYFNESESNTDCSLGGFNCATQVNVTNNTPLNFTKSYRIAITTTQASIAKYGFSGDTNVLYSFETAYPRPITGMNVILPFQTGGSTVLYKCEGEAAGCPKENITNWTGSLTATPQVNNNTYLRSGDSMLDLFYVTSWTTATGGSGGAGGGAPPPEVPPPEVPLPEVPPPEIPPVQQVIEEALQTNTPTETAPTSVIAETIQEATNNAVSLPPNYEPTIKKDNVITAIASEIESVSALRLFGVLPLGLFFIMLIMMILIPTYNAIENEKQQWNTINTLRFGFLVPVLIICIISVIANQLWIQVLYEALHGAIK